MLYVQAGYLNNGPYMYVGCSAFYYFCKYIFWWTGDQERMRSLGIVEKSPQLVPWKSPLRIGPPKSSPEKFSPKKVSEKVSKKVPEKVPEKGPPKMFPEKVPWKVPEKVPVKVPEKVPKNWSTQKIPQKVP